MNIPERDQARFWAQVALPNEQGCMLWMGRPDKKGYARFTLAGRSQLVHRISYVIAFGPIPAGAVIDHVKANGCRHRHCVAPAHLEAVTSAENNRRSASPTAINARKTHCHRGHAFDEANTYNDPAGQRQCRACRALNEREYKKRKRSA